MRRRGTGAARHRNCRNKELRWRTDNSCCKTRSIQACLNSAAVLSSKLQMAGIVYCADDENGEDCSLRLPRHVTIL
jgi:hypothetical protein